MGERRKTWFSDEFMLDWCPSDGEHDKIGNLSQGSHNTYHFTPARFDTSPSGKRPQAKSGMYLCPLPAMTNKNQSRR